jgi:hypothetical protein
MSATRILVSADRISSSAVAIFASATEFPCQQSEFSCQRPAFPRQSEFSCQRLDFSRQQSDFSCQRSLFLRSRTMAGRQHCADGLCLLRVSARGGFAAGPLRGGRLRRRPPSAEGPGAGRPSERERGPRADRRALGRRPPVGVTGPCAAAARPPAAPASAPASAPDASDDISLASPASCAASASSRRLYLMIANAFN